MSKSKPTSRQEFKDWCLRRLGAPVLQINVEDDQVEDLIDYALLTYYDYHFDGSEKVYYKYQVTANNRPMVISDIDILAGGSGYANGEAIIFTGDSGSGANASITTDINGAITGVTFDARGTGYLNPPTLSVNTASGSGASLEAHNGGYIPIPDNIIGTINIFDIGDAIQTNNMFNIRYQIVLNDLYTLTSVSLIPYFMTMQHLQFMEYLLIGKQPIRYNRHKNKLYLDLNWDRFGMGSLVIAECYQVVDPDKYTDAWHDRWLMNYCTALVKRQWGTNMKKFTGLRLPNGVEFSGQQIFDEANVEIQALEKEMINSYSLPVMDMIG